MSHSRAYDLDILPCFFLPQKWKKIRWLKFGPQKMSDIFILWKLLLTHWFKNYGFRLFVYIMLRHAYINHLCMFDQLNYFRHQQCQWMWFNETYTYVRNQHSLLLITTPICSRRKLHQLNYSDYYSSFVSSFVRSHFFSFFLRKIIFNSTEYKVTIRQHVQLTWWGLFYI